MKRSPPPSTAYSEAVLTCYNNLSALFDDSGIDYLNQPFVLNDPVEGFILSTTESIETLQATVVTSTAIFATQLGAALAIGIVMLLMTTAGKRKTLPFIFNQLALLCDVIRCALQIAQLSGALLNFTVLELSLFTGSSFRQAITESVAGQVFTFLLFCFIELALITQARVICAAASRLQRMIITCFSIFVGLVAVAFRIYLMVLNIHGTLNVDDVSAESQAKVSKAQNMANISAIVSICIFSIIFCVKLFLAIRSRRAMGLKQFGPMQIIFIMGCQTLILPAIFAILAYYVFAGAQLQSVVETFVAVFLPLSSIWASANTKARLAASNHAAVIALPEYNRKEAGKVSDEPRRLVDTEEESSDGLQADERQYRSRHDRNNQRSTLSIDRYVSGGQERDIELQQPAHRTTPSLGRPL